MTKYCLPMERGDPIIGGYLELCTLDRKAQPVSQLWIVVIRNNFPELRKIYGACWPKREKAFFVSCKFVRQNKTKTTCYKYSRFEEWTQNNRLLIFVENEAIHFQKFLLSHRCSLPTSSIALCA